MAELKTLNALTRAAAKTWNALASANWKTWNALDTVTETDAVYAYLDDAIINTDLTTYSFASINFGDESADRLIVVMSGIGASTSRTLASGTIGGVAATLAVAVSGRVHAMYAVVPTGTSGTVEMTFGGAAVRCGITVHSVKDYASSTPTDTANSGLITNDDATAALDVAAGGVSIATAWSSATTTLNNWAGGTENATFNFGAEANTMTSAYNEVEELNHSMTVTLNTSGSIQCVAVSWA